MTARTQNVLGVTTHVRNANLQSAALCVDATGDGAMTMCTCIMKALWRDDRKACTSEISLAWHQISLVFLVTTMHLFNAPFLKTKWCLALKLANLIKQEHKTGQTRAVFITLTLYQLEISLFCHCHSQLTLPPGRSLETPKTLFWNLNCCCYYINIKTT